MNALISWLDHRTRIPTLLHELLFEQIPGGPRWRYAWGSTVLFAFFMQLVTGFCMWMNYSPSATTAWESVYYIQHQMTGGAILRGLHHYTAQIFVVLLALHTGQMVIDGAYRAPREFRFWITLLMLNLAVFLSVTGWALPWDQRGFYGSFIPTNLMLLAPGIGPVVRKIVIGGTEYGGHHTLTRFFSLHVGLLPLLMITCFVLRMALARKHGRHWVDHPRRAAAPFWPDQFLRNVAACLVVALLALFLTFRVRLLNGGAIGVPLMAPADSSQPYSAARPEPVFIWLFQMLKEFPGHREVIGAIVIPGAAMTLLALMPFIGRWKLGRGFNIAFVGACGIAILVLGGKALWADWHDEDYRNALARAESDGRRAVQLAEQRGIPPAGAITLVRDDPVLQGPRLFAQNCASCHRYDGHDGLGNRKSETPTAADLKGFATRQWLDGLFDKDKVASPHYFGGTAFKDGEMVQFVQTTVAGYDDEKRQRLENIKQALVADANLPGQVYDEAKLARVAAGRAALKTKAARCINCHIYDGAGDIEHDGPDLTAYGSRRWTIDFISNAAHERFYGTCNDRMPLYGQKKLLTQRQIELIVDWLRDPMGQHDTTEQPPPQATQPTTQPATRPN